MGGPATNLESFLKKTHNLGGYRTKKQGFELTHED